VNHCNSDIFKVIVTNIGVIVFLNATFVVNVFGAKAESFFENDFLTEVDFPFPCGDGKMHAFTPCTCSIHPSTLIRGSSTLPTYALSS
jgi:hypothetical protein